MGGIEDLRVLDLDGASRVSTSKKRRKLSSSAATPSRRPAGILLGDAQRQKAFRYLHGPEDVVKIGQDRLRADILEAGMTRCSRVISFAGQDGADVGTQEGHQHAVALIGPVEPGRIR